MDIDNLDNDLDLSFFADDDELEAPENQDDKVSLEKSEYEALKAKATAQQAQAEAIAKPQPQPSETAALDEYFDKRFEQKVPQLNDLQMQQAAIVMAKSQHPELAQDEDLVAPFVARAAKEAHAKGEQADYLTIINRGVELYKSRTGKATTNANQQNALKYGMMQPDVKGASQPKSKLTAEKIYSMPSDKFQELDRKVYQAGLNGQRVIL